ncbi:hypothetical protein LWI28_018400 [Acer negundo]|uniref:Uncharacterized protein n=1 Tax=Acer negundo TaxID=4023 RepID=A0AAD5J5M2_ACENE|nr:hypothetical protein LWI28_018400 [Acer negundo]
MTNPKDSSFASQGSTSQGSNSQGSNDLLSNLGSDDPFFIHHSDNPIAILDELTSLSTVFACTYGHGHTVVTRVQEDRAMEFLQGLHDRFSAICSQILLMDPFSSVARIYSLIRQEEKQQEIHTLSNTVLEAAALNFQRQNYRQSQPYNSGKFG